MAKMEMLKIKVRTCVKACFDGEKIAGGRVLESAEFAKKRSARISLYGTIEGSDKEVAVVLTPRMTGVGEFMALNEIIEREGTFEVLGKVEESAEINGEIITYDPPRVAVELSDESGEAQFKFTPRAVAKWASKFGEFKTEAVDYGRDEEANKAMAQRRRQARNARKSASETATATTESI
jgi:hypothetical protein